MLHIVQKFNSLFDEINFKGPQARILGQEKNLSAFRPFLLNFAIADAVMLFNLYKKTYFYGTALKIAVNSIFVCCFSTFLSD